MPALEILDVVHKAGGSLMLTGEKIKYAIPKASAWLVSELWNQREDVSELLRQRAVAPAMPLGVRLLKWEPKTPAVPIVRIGIVEDVNKFVAATLRELGARLEGRDFLAGNWSLPELVDRPEQVGVDVEIESTPTRQEQR